MRPDHATQQYVFGLNDPQVNRYLECGFVNHAIESTKNFIGDIGITSHVLDRYLGKIKIEPIDKTMGSEV